MGLSTNPTRRPFARPSPDWLREKYIGERLDCTQIELSKPYLLDGAKYCEAALRERDMPTLFDLLEDATFPDAAEIERVTAKGESDAETEAPSE